MCLIDGAHNCKPKAEAAIVTDTTETEGMFSTRYEAEVKHPVK